MAHAGHQEGRALVGKEGTGRREEWGRGVGVAGPVAERCRTFEGVVAQLWNSYLRACLSESERRGFDNLLEGGDEGGDLREF